jgi:tryptophanyl-tRNA synthetase
MAKPILVSGIQPTGRVHIGNYLGMMKPCIDLQGSSKYQCYLPIVDLHSLTEGFTPEEKKKQILEVTADFLALGLDPKKCTFFLQSQVSAHSELAWILNTLTPMGELERMTQFKDKSDRHGANAGLFTYPVLMTADVILYNGKIVPVGEDQLQHIELMRTLVRKFNTRFGETFVEPEALLSEAKRIMSLSDPSKKMSKSVPASCLFLDDSPEEVLQKVKRSVTDSGNEVKYEKEHKPAVSNLLTIYSSLSGKAIVQIEKKYNGKGYGQFKTDLAELIINYFEPYRRRKIALLKKTTTLVTTLKKGSVVASKQANKKMADVKKKIGIAL